MNLQELLAAQVASGGQNVITPQNAGRILGLAAQQEANRQLSLIAGRQAVEERKKLQELEAGQGTPGVVTAPSGAKFVYDKQGNVVGTNAPIGIGDSVDKGAINRGEATAQERMLLGPAIREAFTLEMQKKAPRAPEPAPSAPPRMTPAQSSAFLAATAPTMVAAPAPTPMPGNTEQVLDYQTLLSQAQQAEAGLSTPEQDRLMKEVADKRREEMGLAEQLQEALKTGDRPKISAFRKEMERIRKDMLATREKAYPGSTTALSPADRRLKERMLLQD